MDDEIWLLEKNDTWKLIEPIGKKALLNKWVYSIKNELMVKLGSRLD